MTFDFAGLSSTRYITERVYRYIGTDWLTGFIKRFAAKKAGVEEMVEINNQRKAFLKAGVVGGNW